MIDGIWSHYVGDGSQPLHVSIHFNGWGDFPNPNGYTNSKKIHAYFEGEFVRSNLKRAAVAAQVGQYQNCGCSIEEKARKLLATTLANVVPFYKIEKQGGFKAYDQRGIDFATARLALGAQFIRDTIYDAWLASADAMVGYPMVSVRDIEAGKVRATPELMGAD